MCRVQLRRPSYPCTEKGWGRRVVSDYRFLKSVTVKDRYPLPRIDDYLNNVQGAKYFSSMDALDGFHQVPMNKEDIEKTAVVTPFGSYVWKVMPMGVANAPAMFQRMMNRIFGHMVFLKVYMDDVLIHSETKEKHFQHLEQFFEVCSREDIRLKRSKCAFFQSTLEWVGYRIKEGEMTCTDHLAQKIKNFPRPTTQRENMAFLGLCQFYMRFVPQYTDMAAPLTDLNQAACKYDFQRYWKPPQEKAFQDLVQALTSSPVLCLFSEDLPIRVETDASDTGMGAALMQQHENGEWRPTEYWSKKFNNAQLNYHPAEKETCAIIYALQHWRHLLFGQPFTVLTDNKASQYLTSKATEQLSPREMRWSEKLGYFAPFTIEYRPGNMNGGPDYFSRHASEKVDRKKVCILDICAGTGTVLRALGLVIPVDSPLMIDYVAVEQDEACRSAILRVFHQVRLEHPGLFTRKDIFRYGNDVVALTSRRCLPKVDLIIAGVPCQPFSRANNSSTTPPLGLRDVRELFTAVDVIKRRLKNPDYLIECTPFATHLDKDFEMVNQWFGEPELHDLSLYCAQARQRYCWTSLSGRIGSTIEFSAIPLLWQDCLDKGATVPKDGMGHPVLKCPSIMASTNSHSDRNQAAWVINEDNSRRPMTATERERVVGMQAGDTAAAGVTETDRHRMCGNAFPVGWIASMLWPWIQNHTRTLRPLACRSPAGTVCGLLASNTEIQANSTYTAEGGAGANPTILQRLRTAALADAKYQDLVHAPGSNYLSKDGLLFLSGGEHQAVVIPGNNALRQDLLHLVHDRAHFGVTRTYLSALRHFYWAGIRGHIRHFVARCPTCQLQKPSNQERHQQLFPETRFYPHPFHTVVLDVVENLPLTPRGHDAVLTVVDRLTKFAIYIPIHSSWSSHQQAIALLDNVVFRYHCPARIITDNGPAYRALFRSFCATLGAFHITGTPYHSQSQGGAERQHRTLLQTLRSICDDKINWDMYLQAAAHAYNDSEHSVTHHSPFQLLYGCHSRLPWHLQIPSLDTPTKELTELTLDRRIANILNGQRKMYDVVLDKLQKGAKRMQDATASRSPKEFPVGTKVKVMYGLKGPTDKHKLEPYYVGPYIIKQNLGKGAYRLLLPPGSAFSDRINADRLEPWIDSDFTLFPNDKDTLPATAPLPVPTLETGGEIIPRIRRYLLRDYSLFPEQPARYYVESNQSDAAERYFWINESTEILNEFLALEENNGCIPEKGISSRNVKAVRAHKVNTYLQYPSPIVSNTWTYQKLPFATRRPPTWKPPQRLKGQIVHEFFYEEGTSGSFYQGRVVEDTSKGCRILWTDGQTSIYSRQKTRSLLYNPVAYVYDFHA